MRKIGEIEQAEPARVFSDYLYAQGIANTVELAEGDQWEVWIHDEEQQTTSREALSQFLESPDKPEYQLASQQAEKQKRKEADAQAAHNRKLHTGRHVFRGGLWRSTPVTGVLIFLSLIATFFGGLGADSPLTPWLLISESGGESGRMLPEIFRGQVWRLFTPVFLHAAVGSGYGILHILFNMLWLKDLGGMIERVEGGRSLLLKVLLIGVLSNLAQFALRGPFFGGMSGVVFGLLGYAWLRGKLDLTSGLFVHGQTMMMMTFWFVLCLSGVMGPIANAAHGAGLAAGLAWGYALAWRTNTAR